MQLFSENEWVSKASEPAGAHVCPRVWDLWKFDTRVKEIKFQKKNLPKIQLSQFCYSNQCWEAGCENNQQMGKMCLTKLVVSV